jgi:acetyltransferase-like isoleucine patch superfamily enzyme
MLLKQLKHFLIRRFKNMVFEMVRTVENDRQKEYITRTLNQMKSSGNGIKFNGSFTIMGPYNVSIGNNVHIGRNAFFHGFGGLTIEDNVHISRNVTIYTGNHDYAGQVLPYDQKLIAKPVHIGKNVWIGMNVSIVPGVTIGEGAIVGMGTVVSRDVPPLAIACSSPLRIVKHRDSAHYTRLENQSSYGGVGGIPLSADEIQAFKRNPKDEP